MPSLGSYLRERRESRGLSLVELSTATRVAIRHLTALESDDAAALPPAVFTRGFIRACCAVLQSPVDEALALYHQQTGVPPPLAAASAPVRSADPSPRKGNTVLVSFVLVVVLGLSLFAVTMALQSSREGAADRMARGDHEASVPSTTALDGMGPEDAPNTGIEVATPAPPPPAPSAPSAPAAATPAPTIPAPAAPVVSARPAASSPPTELSAIVGGVTTPYRLIARVSEPTWIRVRLEDGRATEETVPAGEVREWVSNAPFVITVGNAGGVKLELNGRPLPPLGARGAVISRLVIPPPTQ